MGGGGGGGGAREVEDGSEATAAPARGTPRASPGGGSVRPQRRQNSVPSAERVPHWLQTGTSAPQNYMLYLTSPAPLSTRVVALVTRDPLVYALCAQVLKERRWPAVTLLPGERLPERVAVALTSEAEAGRVRHPNVLAVTEEGDHAAIWAAVEASLASSHLRGEVVVGIDSGPRPGYAVLAEDRVVAEGSLDSPESTANLGASLGTSFAGRTLRFRIGSGDPLLRDRIVKSLLPLGHPVELVDERGTTPRGQRRPKDAVAARAIGRLRGRPAQRESLATITAGDIANLQRLSRERSGGRLTIPRSDARKVLRGELTLTEAIDARTDRGSPSRGQSGLERARRELS